MKSTYLLMVFLASIAVAQTERGLIYSDPFLLKPKREALPPRITILDPSVGEGGSVVLSKPQLTVVGAASSANGIRKIEVSGVTTIPSESGGFTVRLPVKNGTNQVTISAEDNAGNVSKVSFTALFDTRAPTITVLQPVIQNVRGIRNVVVDTCVLIGRVYDDCLLSEVTVNGVQVTVGQDSLFTMQLSPRREVDTVRIAATDIGGHTSEVVFPIALKSRRADLNFLSGRSYAIIVGIDAYKGRWPRLQNAVNDARSIARILSSRFQFYRVDSLYDEQATRDRILGTIETFGRTLRPEDRLLIYYSGHGLKEPPYNKGYWVPVDATDRSIGRYISNRDIQDYLGGMNPQHVLLVADACFAGDIFKGSVVRVEFEENVNYYKRVSGAKSRKALTSGGDEPVMDGGSPGHSVFASYFLRALEEINKPYFSAWEVYERLRIGVANNSEQMPQFDAIKNTGDEGGEFIFVRR